MRLLLLSATLLLGARIAAAESAAAELLFETHIRPILKAHCWHCHGESESLEGGLDARWAKSLLRGGDSGPAITAGDHAASLTFQRITAGEMPPGNKRLPPADVELLARWIDDGARTARPEPDAQPAGYTLSDEERSHWSFQAVRRPPVPAVIRTDQVRSPIDAFLLSALEAKGLSFSPQAELPALVRRLYFDLTGLPPSPDDIERIVRNESPDAYEHLVDELLASTAYGEHWARHWLDVVGYADSDGYSGLDPPRKWAFRYRDYVIRALNEDKPWNEFIVEQLAGDELLTGPLTNVSPDEAEKLIATGMLRMAPDGTADAAVDQNLARNEVIAGTIKIVSSALLGLTVGCAQCHDHRYDPVSQVDYYALRAIFEPALDWQNWRSSDARLVSLWTDEIRRQAADVRTELEDVTRRRNEELDQLVKKTFETELAKLPAEMQPLARAAHDAPLEKRTSDQIDLIKQHPFLNVDRSSVYLYLPDRLTEFNKRWDEREASTRLKLPADDFVHCLTEVPGQAPTTRLFARGDFHTPKQEVAPAELAVLNPTGERLPPDDPAIPTSGRRLAYARRLTNGQHPLTARVLVNRFWLHHFGHGLVATPGDFGLLGQRPSHPELLDWLADEFMAGGWKLKRLHRLIVTSTAYRQSSRRRPEYDSVDPENRLLGRANVQRLSAEVLRDALLAISGRLSRKMYGPPVPVTPDDVGQIIVGVDTRDSSGRPTGKVVDLGEEQYRRSIYIQSRRTQRVGLLETFDAPIMAPNCEQRSSSTNSAQSLMLLNNAFVIEQAVALAQRVASEAGEQPDAQFVQAWRIAFGHAPSAEQVAAGVAFLREQRAVTPAETGGATASASPALAHLCQALLISNGYLYVE